MSSLDINGNLFLLIRNMTRMDGQSSGGKNMISFLMDMVLRRGGERERRKTKKEKWGRRRQRKRHPKAKLTRCWLMKKEEEIQTD